MLRTTESLFSRHATTTIEAAGSPDFKPIGQALSDINEDSMSRHKSDHPSDDPTLQHAGADLMTRYLALGFDVEVTTNDRRIEEAARGLFGTACSQSGEAPTVRLRVLVDHVNEEPSWNTRQPLIREQAHLFTITASRATAIAGDKDRLVAAGFVSETVAAMPDFLRHAIVQPAFLTVISSKVLGAIHTACITKNGRSLMLRGDQGAGKSTMAYVALRSGFSLVAEDVVFPRKISSDGAMTLHGLPWSMFLMPDAVRFFPELGTAPLINRYTGETKIGVDVLERFPGLYEDAVPLGPTVFVARATDGQSRLTPLDPASFRRELEATAIEFERRAAREHGLWEAMLRFPAYRLVVGPDPFSAVPLLESLVADSG